MISVSVIIPVYNAAKFLEKALESVLIQPEVKEIILVEDGSKDNSHEICLNICEKYDIVKLYVHEKNSNRGASASRELGINMATQNYVSFLDADDFYLPNRFFYENQIFEQYSDADGVYGATGFEYYYEEGKKKYKKFDENGLTTISSKVSPSEVFYVLTGISKIARGHIHLNALTIKKSVVSSNKAGNFNPNMGLHEDSEWIYRLSMKGNLYPGSIFEPVAMRGVHEENRIVNNKNEHYTRYLKYKTVFEWVKLNEVDTDKSNIIRVNLLFQKLYLINFFCGIILLIWYHIRYFNLTKKKIYIIKSLTFILGEPTFKKFLFLYKKWTANT
jgi:glycosyltransferase involved in cell wall biosynthesis